jgi:hypothetical protein
MLEPKIIIRNQYNETFSDKKIKFIKRIDNDGESLITLETDYIPPIIGETIFRITGCLSITFKRWIATDGMSTYIVELIDL